jgi:hypothetical protein
LPHHSSLRSVARCGGGAAIAIDGDDRGDRGRDGRRRRRASRRARQRWEGTRWHRRRTACGKPRIGSGERPCSSAAAQRRRSLSTSRSRATREARSVCIRTYADARVNRLTRRTLSNGGTARLRSGAAVRAELVRHRTLSVERVAADGQSRVRHDRRALALRHGSAAGASRGTPPRLPRARDSSSTRGAARFRAPARPRGRSRCRSR